MIVFECILRLALVEVEVSSFSLMEVQVDHVHTLNS